MKNKPSISFIGCGKVSMTIGKLIYDSQSAKILDVYNRNEAHSKEAINFIGSGTLCKQLNLLKHADIYFLGTPDDQIEKTCLDILQAHSPKIKSIFVHFSGALSSDALKLAEEKGMIVCSLHPIKSFASPEKSINNFRGTYCGFEGNMKGFDILKSLFEKIGGELLIIDKEKKDLYHTACVLSSNYLVSLSHCAANCFKNTGINEEQSTELVLSLMESALQNIKALKDIKMALTGPIIRGDKQTIEKHLAALNFNNEIKKIYQNIGLYTLNNFDLNTKNQLNELFQENELK